MPFRWNNGLSNQASVWTAPLIVGLVSIAAVGLVKQVCASTTPLRPVAEAQSGRDSESVAAQVALGRSLFYDTRLSANGTMSCATCHQQALAFTDGKAHAVGSTGKIHPRSTPSLTNVAFAKSLGWANPLLARLEDQVRIPMFGEEPVEMGLPNEGTLLRRLSQDANDRDAFARAFGGDATVSMRHIAIALSCFQRTLVSNNSPYDRYTKGDRGALSDAQVRGMALFFGERLECFHCHGGPSFSDSFDHRGQIDAIFHDTGLPSNDVGLAEVTGKKTDHAHFKTPTLRNVEVTAPYMHDGSLTSLEAVVDHYASGGQTRSTKDVFLKGFVITDDERADVVAFLRSLTDRAFLEDKKFADPRLEKSQIHRGGT